MIDYSCADAHSGRHFSLRLMRRLERNSHFEDDDGNRYEVVKIIADTAGTTHIEVQRVLEIK